MYDTLNGLSMAGERTRFEEFAFQRTEPGSQSSFTAVIKIFLKTNLCCSNLCASFRNHQQDVIRDLRVPVSGEFMYINSISRQLQ